jgi:hypothetical protein
MSAVREGRIGRRMSMIRRIKTTLPAAIAALPLIVVGANATFTFGQNLDSPSTTTSTPEGWECKWEQPTPPPDTYPPPKKSGYGLVYVCHWQL